MCNNNLIKKIKKIINKIIKNFKVKIKWKKKV